MIINKPRLGMLTMGSAALLVVGSAMAAPPTGFSYGQYTTNNGVATVGTITTTDTVCGVTYTCVSLAASGDGILQRQVTENLTGKSYIQTIIVDNLTAGPADTGLNVNAIVGGTYNLDFTNESFVGVGGGASGDLGVDAGIKLLAPPGGPVVPNTVDALGGNQQMVATIAQGGLVTPGDPTHVKIIQRQKLDPGGATGVDGTGQTDFVLMSNSADESDRYMRLDQRVTANVVQGITVRNSSGSYTTGGPANLTLPDSSSLGYVDGDSIGVVWIQLRQMGGAGLPASDPRVFQMQSYDVNGTKIAWNSCNADGFGACVPANSTANGDPTPATWDYWDANFGTAPNPLNGDTFANPTSFFPNFPD